MHFTNPTALWLLLLLPVPLLLTHRRKPMARHVVSNLYLWRAAAGRASGSLALRRVRRTWLVALQMACIASIVAALGGPVVTLGGGRTVLVFDVSASMAALEDGATRFDEARAHARAIVRALPPASRVRLTLAAASPRELGDWAASDPLLASAIGALAPTAGRADVAAAIDIATRRGYVDHIIVFSDITLAARGTGRPDSPTVQWVRVGHVAENAAVTRIAARPTTLGGRAGQILVVLRNYGTQPRDADVEVSVDGQLAHRTHVVLSPAGPQTLNVALPDLGRLVTARLVGHDALALDDARSAAVPLANPIRVALLGPRGSFLERALAVNRSVALRPYDSGTSPAEIESASSRDDFDVLVCDGCGSPPPAISPALVVAAAGGEPVRGPLTLASTAHPLAAALEPGQQAATIARSTAAHAGAEVILRVGGVPAVTASDLDGRRTIDVHLDLSQGDFVLSPAFPVLIANALEWLTEQRDLPTETTAGEPLAFAMPLAPRNVVSVVGPDGRPRDVQRVGRQFIVGDTDTAGEYRVRANGSDRLVIVNPAVDGESNLSAAAGASFNQSETTPPVSVSGPVAVGRWLALMGLALLALDWRFRIVGAS